MPNRSKRYRTTLLIGLSLVVLGSAQVAAQDAPAPHMPVQLSLRTGIVAGADAYQSGCGYSSLAFSLAVQGRGRLFPHASLDHYSGAGGGDVLCLRADPSVSIATGGLRLEGATRVGAGAGARLGRGLFQLEAVAEGGFITGQAGYADPRRDRGRMLRPQIGGQGTLVLLRHLLLSAAIYSTRLSLEVTPVAGGATTTRHEWSPMTTWQFGIRLGNGSGF